MTWRELDRLRDGSDRELAFAAAVVAELERQNDVDGGLAEEVAGLRWRVAELAAQVAALAAPVELDAGAHSRSVKA